MKKFVILWLLCSNALLAQGSLQLTADLSAGASSSRPAWLGTIGHNMLFWTGNNSSKQLYAASGLTGNLEFLKDLAIDQNPHTPVGTPAYLDNALYFVTHDGPAFALWSSDGTAAGTVLRTILPALDQPQNFCAFNQKLWFSTGRNLLNYSPISGVIDTFYLGEATIEHLTATNEGIYWFELHYLNPYVARNYLRMSAGQPGDVIIVKDVGESTSSTTGSTHVEKRMAFRNWRLGWSTYQLSYYASSVYYGGGQAVLEGFPTYFTSGIEQCILSTAFTDSFAFIMTADRYKSAVPPYENNWQLLAFGSSGFYGSVLPAETMLSLDADAPNADRILPGRDVLYFRASTYLNGSELYRSDGSFSGTHILQDLLPGTASSNPVLLDLCAEKALLFARDSLGYGLWMSDSAGTVLEKIAEMPQGYQPTAGEWGKVVDNTLFVKIFTNAYGFELWALSGLPCGATVQAFQPEKEVFARISPNPTTGNFRVMFPGNSAYELALYDPLGRIIARQTATGDFESKILETQAPGLYFLMIRQGRRTQAFRLVKQ